MPSVTGLKDRLTMSASSRTARMLRRKIPQWIWALVRLLFLLGLTFVVLYPILVAASVAFRATEDISDPSVLWIPKHFTLQNIVDTLELMDYGEAFIGSIRLGLVSSLFQVASCSLIGYGFARFRFRFKSLLFALVLFTFMVPPQVVFVPTYLMYRSINILDTPLAMYLPAIFGVGLRSGLFIYIFRQFYRNLPHEIEDAAFVDGCGYYRSFWKIIIPSSKPAFLTVFLFSLVWYWNDYYTTTMYFTNTRTITTALARLSAAIIQADPNGIGNDIYLVSTRNMAGCLLAILPMLIIYIIFHRFFTEGIERTGIVG